MTKLSDLQLVLLTAAAQRPDGNLLPPPDSVADPGARIGKAIVSLLKRTLIVEIDAGTMEPSWREEGERRIGVVITDAGRQAISVSGCSPTSPRARSTSSSSTRSTG